MSYILDALKRAEKERKLGRAPTALDDVAGTVAAEVGASPLRRRLLLALLFVVAVALGAGAVLLLRHPGASGPVAAEPAPQPAAAEGPAVPAEGEVVPDQQAGAGNATEDASGEMPVDDEADAKIADGEHIASLDDLTGEGATAPPAAASGAANKAATARAAAPPPAAAAPTPQPAAVAPTPTPAPVPVPAISQIEQQPATRSPPVRSAAVKPAPRAATAPSRRAEPAARQSSSTAQYPGDSDLRSPPAGPRVVIRNYSGGPQVLPPQPTATSVLPPATPPATPALVQAQPPAPQPVAPTPAPAPASAAAPLPAPAPALTTTATAASTPAAASAAPGPVSEPPPPAEVAPKPRRPARQAVPLQDEAPVTMAARPALRGGGPRIATPGIESIKKLKEMPPAYRAEFPSINIDVHAYTDDPVRSFVILSGKRYKAGDNLAEGPHIADIVPEGIIFDWRGERVLVTLPH